MKKPAIVFFGATLAIIVVASGWLFLGIEHPAPNSPLASRPSVAFHTSTTPKPQPKPKPFHTMTTPAALNIPAISVSAPIEKVGLTRSGNMDTPKTDTTLGWYQGGAFPGNPGPAVLAGHTGHPARPSLFRNLEKLKPGDNISVRDDRGESAQFRVTELAVYTPESAPRQRIFGRTTTRQLVIITCTGAWEQRTQTYSHRLVVYTERIEDI